MHAYILYILYIHVHICAQCNTGVHMYIYICISSGNSVEALPGEAGDFYEAWFSLGRKGRGGVPIQECWSHFGCQTVLHAEKMRIKQFLQ